MENGVKYIFHKSHNAIIIYPTFKILNHESMSTLISGGGVFRFQVEGYIIVEFWITLLATWICLFVCFFFSFLVSFLNF